jgi:hypothetical protein
VTADRAPESVDVKRRPGLHHPRPPAIGYGRAHQRDTHAQTDGLPPLDAARTAFTHFEGVVVADEDRVPDSAATDRADRNEPKSAHSTTLIEQGQQDRSQIDRAGTRPRHSMAVAWQEKAMAEAQTTEPE